MSHLPFIESIKGRDPKFYDSISSIEEMISSEGALSGKMKLMLSLAVDMALGQDEGVRSLAKVLRKTGTTEEELSEICRIVYFAKGNGVLESAQAAFEE